MGKLHSDANKDKTGGNGIIKVPGYDIVKSNNGCEGCAFDISATGLHGTCSFKSNPHAISMFKERFGIKAYEEALEKEKKKLSKGNSKLKKPLVKIYPSCNKVDSPYRWPFIYVKKDNS